MPTVGEFDAQGSSDSDTPVCARQPRTLSMAIVPGDHIKSILLATRENVGESSDDAEKVEESTADSGGHDVDSGRNQTECVSTL